MADPPPNAATVGPELSEADRVALEAQARRMLNSMGIEEDNPEAPDKLGSVNGVLMGDAMKQARVKLQQEARANQAAEEARQRAAIQAEKEAEAAAAASIAANPWLTPALEAVHLRLVAAPHDIGTSPTFAPTFVHQVFGDREVIYGYKDLAVTLSYDALTLVGHLAVDASETTPAATLESISKPGALPPPDDIRAKIGEWLEEGALVPTIDDLCAIVEGREGTAVPGFGDLADGDGRRPPGAKIHEYTRETSVVGPDGAASTATSTFEVYRGNLQADEGVHALHRRLRFLAVLYIDGAQYIDDTDERWDVYLLFKTWTADLGSAAGPTRLYSLVGYSTVYSFYHHPESTRPRVSQFLILPPFQRSGHGRELLSAIYAHAAVLGAYEVTVEDPSPDFVFLRDLVDTRNLRPFFPADPVPVWSADAASRARDALRITPKQIRRGFEVLARAAAGSDPDRLTAYRLDVKQRLRRDHATAFTDGSLTLSQQKDVLSDLFAAADQQYAALAAAI